MHRDQRLALLAGTLDDDVEKIQCCPVLGLRRRRGRADLLAEVEEVHELQRRHGEPESKQRGKTAYVARPAQQRLHGAGAREVVLQSGRLLGKHLLDVLPSAALQQRL